MEFRESERRGQFGYSLRLLLRHALRPVFLREEHYQDDVRDQEPGLSNVYRCRQAPLLQRHQNGQFDVQMQRKMRGPTELPIAVLRGSQMHVPMPSGKALRKTTLPGLPKPRSLPKIKAKMQSGKIRQSLVGK